MVIKRENLKKAINENIENLNTTNNNLKNINDIIKNNKLKQYCIKLYTNDYKVLKKLALLKGCNVSTLLRIITKEYINSNI